MERHRARDFNLNSRIRAWRLSMSRFASLRGADLDELEDHLREEIRELVDGGTSLPEAFRLARLRLGGEQTLDDAFERLSGGARRRRQVADFLQSARFSLRRLRRRPTFSIITVVTLSIGIGTTTAIFSLVNAVLLKPLDYPEPARLVSVSHSAPGMGYDDVQLSLATFLTFQHYSRTLASLGVWNRTDAAVSGTAAPHQVTAVDVTADLLTLLGARPELGRLFVADDMIPGSPGHVVLDYGYWQSRLGGDPTAVGQTLRINGSFWQVIGVLPEGFQILDYPASLYLPFRFDPSKVQLTNFSYDGIGRLRAGVDLEQVERELAPLIVRATEDFPQGITLRMLQEARFDTRVAPLHQKLVGDISSTLWLLLATVGLILLIAWVNVFNLFVVRVEEQQPEMAIRTALGAGRGRLLAEWMQEGAVLGLLGGAGGLVLAAAGSRLILLAAPEGLPRATAIGFDLTVLAFNFGLAAAAGILLGLLPVMRRRSDPQTALQRRGRGGVGSGQSRFRLGLATVEVALALVLIVASGLMLRSLSSLGRVDSGFDSSGQVTGFRMPIPFNEIRSRAEAAVAVENILTSLETIPEVVSVAATSSLPMEGRSAGDSIDVEDFPAPEGVLPDIHRLKFVAGDYLATLQIPLLAGRSLDLADFREQRAVAMVSESFARRFWGDPAAALGKRIQPSESRWHEIVGVTGDVRDHGLTEEAPSLVYLPVYGRQIWDNEEFLERQLAWVVRLRSQTPANGLLSKLEAAVWDFNPNLPLANLQPLDVAVRQSTARTSFTLLMLGIGATIAVALGAVGVYGVLSYSAAERTREIGLRMALGADGRQIRDLVLRQGWLVAGAGTAAGALAAAAFSPAMAPLLSGVGPLDPWTYASAAALVVAVALLASYIPARRAAALDPVEALRD